MQPEFTSAACRALAAAAWLDRNDCREMAGPALLLGLWPSRSAALRWVWPAQGSTPRLSAIGGPNWGCEICSICWDIPPAAALRPFEFFFSAARQRLADFPQPLVSPPNISSSDWSPPRAKRRTGFAARGWSAMHCSMKSAISTATPLIGWHWRLASAAMRTRARRRRHPTHTSPKAPARETAGIVSLAGASGWRWPG